MKKNKASKVQNLWKAKAHKKDTKVSEKWKTAFVDDNLFKSRIPLFLSYNWHSENPW